MFIREIIATPKPERLPLFGMVTGSVSSIFFSSVAIAEYGGAVCSEGSLTDAWSYQCKYETLVEFLHDEKTSGADSFLFVSEFVCDPKTARATENNEISFWYFAPEVDYSAELSAKMRDPDIRYAVNSHPNNAETIGWNSHGSIDVRNIIDNDVLEKTRVIPFGSLTAVSSSEPIDGTPQLMPTLIREGSSAPDSNCASLILSVQFRANLAKAKMTLSGPLSLPDTRQTKIDIDQRPKILGGSQLSWDLSTFETYQAGWYQLVIHGFPGSRAEPDDFHFLIYLPETT